MAKRTAIEVDLPETVGRAILACFKLLEISGNVPPEAYERTIDFLRRYAKWKGWKTIKRKAHRAGLYALWFSSPFKGRFRIDIVDPKEYPVSERYIRELAAAYRTVAGRPIPELGGYL